MSQLHPVRPPLFIQEQSWTEHLFLRCCRHSNLKGDDMATFAKRRCFFSFHYEPDCFRASQVRNIGAIEGNQPATGNKWEEVCSGKDKAIKDWIGAQMKGKSCVVVLAGTGTANRKWINYEINKAWNDRRGVVVIDVHGLMNRDGSTSNRGSNPLYHVAVSINGVSTRLSTIAKRYQPAGSTSKQRYGWIKENLAAAVEEAITIRSKYR